MPLLGPSEFYISRKYDNNLIEHKSFELWLHMSEIVRANLLNSTGRNDSVESSAIFYDHSDLPDGQRMAAWVSHRFMSNSAQLRFTTLHAELITQVVELSNNSVQAVCEPEVRLTRTDSDTLVQLPSYIEIGNVATMVEYLNSSGEVLELIMEKVNPDYVATDNWRSVKLQ